MPTPAGLTTIAAMRGRRKGGTHPPTISHPQGLDAPIQAFLLQLKTRAYSAGSVDAHRWALQQFSTWAHNHTHADIQLFTRADLTAYQLYLHQYLSPRGYKPLATNTQIARLGCIRRFFAALCRQDIIPANPAADLDLPRKQTRTLPKTLKPNEINQLLALPNTADPFGLRDRAMLEVLYATGLRRTELSQLDIGDYDSTTHTLTIRRGKNGKFRLLPVGERAATWLEKFLTTARPAFAHLAQQTALFLSGYGTRITPAYLGNWIKKLLIRCGIHQPGSCHLFRHTCATDMHRGGADIRYVQEMLGHARMETTQIYTHVHIEALREIHTRCHPHGKLRDEENVEENPPTGKTSFQTDENPLMTQSMIVAEEQQTLRGQVAPEGCRGVPKSCTSKDEPPPEENGGSITSKVPPHPPRDGPKGSGKIIQNTTKPSKISDLPGVVAYYGYRYYAPNLGRWISRDPIGEEGGLHMYAFVTNDGVGKWDILGLKKCCVNSIEVTVGNKFIGSYSKIFGGTNNLEIAAYGLTISASFKNDNPCCCECCEIRWFIMWDENYANSSKSNVKNWPVPYIPLPLPHIGFIDNPLPTPGAWIEDRSQTNQRKGYRDNQNSASNQYKECGYDGRDIVTAPTQLSSMKRFVGKLKFKAVVVDTCGPPLSISSDPAVESKTIELEFK